MNNVRNQDREEIVYPIRMERLVQLGYKLDYKIMALGWSQNQHFRLHRLLHEQLKKQSY